MDSPTMTETEEKIKASAAPTSQTPQTEQKPTEKEVKQDKKEEAEEEEDEEFEEQIIESTGTFYDLSENESQIETSTDEQEPAEEAEDATETETPRFANEEYIKSFENRTIDDILKEEREKEEAQKAAEEKSEQEPAEKVDTRSLKEYFADLRRARNQEAQEVSQQPQAEQTEQTVEQPQGEQEVSSVIEKPNYDFLETDKKVIKITQKKKKREKKKGKKAASIALAVALAFTGGVCIVNSVLIDQQYSAYVEIGDTYELNLQKYLKNLSNLDATKKSMEVFETYPEEVNDAGDLGEVSNWFDRICNFLSGLFGG